MSSIKLYVAASPTSATALKVAIPLQTPCCHMSKQHNLTLAEIAEPLAGLIYVEWQHQSTTMFIVHTDPSTAFRTVMGKSKIFKASSLLKHMYFE
jgi:hypothetical protein